MIRFAHPEYLYALALLPLLVLLYIWARRERRISLEMFGRPDLLNRLIPFAARFRRGTKFALLVLALGFALLGLANPQIGSKLEEVKREGVDIVIALDVSSSMLAEDMKPNRLERAKREISLLIDKLQNDRIGLVVFAGESFLQLPLTSDYGAARLILNAIDVDAVPTPGTAIGSAIRLAKKVFVEGEKKHKVIIIITDGENHEDDASSAAKDASAEGVVVHTIGMGSPLGTPIPVYRGDVQAGFKMDGDGNVVLTKLDESGLEQIASAGSGRYTRASGSESELETLVQEIQAMEKKEFGARIFTEYEDRFQYALLPSFIFLLLEAFLSERRNPLIRAWVRRIMTPLAISEKQAGI